MILGRVVGTVTTQVLRGDRSLTVRAVRPAGEIPFEGRTRFTVSIGALPLAADVPYGTVHTFTHLPDGVVTRVRATTPTATANQWAVGDIAPLVRLDAATPTATIDVPASEPLATSDRYEWDDSPSALVRPPLAVGGSESHTAHSADDVDNIPLAISSAGSYRVLVQPVGKRLGDFAVEVRNPAGAVVGGSNRTLAETREAPGLSIAAPSAGTWMATVRRNDREPVSFAYTLSFLAEP